MDFGKTGVDGRVRLHNLPLDRYVVRVWHPRMETSEETTSRPVSLERASAADLAWELKLKPVFRPRRAPVPGQRSY
jgi:hypothetical protein